MNFTNKSAQIWGWRCWWMSLVVRTMDTFEYFLLLVNPPRCVRRWHSPPPQIGWLWWRRGSRRPISVRSNPGGPTGMNEGDNDDDKTINGGGMVVIWSQFKMCVWIPAADQNEKGRWQEFQENERIEWEGGGNLRKLWVIGWNLILLFVW